MSRQNMANWIMAAQHWLQPIYDRMKQVLLSQDIIFADETTLQVLQEDGKKAESQSYMWLYRSGRYGPGIVLFEYQPTRSGACCFFSSREKTRISPMSVLKNRVSTALPKEPVPPVIRRLLPENTELNPYLQVLKYYIHRFCYVIVFFQISSSTCPHLHSQLRIQSQSPSVIKKTLQISTFHPKTTL